MVSASASAGYLLGNSDAEHERLIRQAKRLAPVTERFLREAGIGSRQRVLDVGAGVGDVSILLSHLVGPAGEVLAVERDARSIDRAKARVIPAGLQNVTFTHTDIAQFSSDTLFDAVVGRYITISSRSGWNTAFFVPGRQIRRNHCLSGRFLGAVCLALCPLTSLVCPCFVDS
jgi:SAM-dependent methyltransferase